MDMQNKKLTKSRNDRKRKEIWTKSPNWDTETEKKLLKVGVTSGTMLS